jgi:ubiquinone/menaquinone biosynthesis C-methylase UbiE
MYSWLRGAAWNVRPFDPRSYFNAPLFDLGEQSPAFANILAPEPERGAEKIGISDQFLENAETYHSRYLNTDHYQRAFAMGLAAAGIVPKPGMKILDIGTGSGANSVVPCARLFDSPRIIATDLSPQLLAILRDFIAKTELEAEVACICTDAMNDFFKAGCFDIVSGAAILHHLLDPRTALRSAYRGLKPGGVALFFEPFEAGHLALCAAYRQILALKDRLRGVSLAAEKVLSAMILDWTTRVGTDKSAPHFPHMDDKWLFTRQFLTTACEEIGFFPPILLPQYRPDELEGSFAGLTKTILRLHSQLLPETLPEWAWELIREFDRTFTQDMKDDLLLEGIIVLRKP